MIALPHDNKYYAENQGFKKLWEAKVYAALVQMRGYTRSVPIYRNGEIVAVKRY